MTLLLMEPSTNGVSAVMRSSSPPIVPKPSGYAVPSRVTTAMARPGIGDRAVIGRPARELFPELADQGLLDVLDRVYSTGESFRADDMVVKWDADGNGVMREERFNLVYQAMRGADGGITGVMSHSVKCG